MDKNKKCTDKIWNKARSIRGLRVPIFRCDAYDCDEKKVMCTHAGYKCYLFGYPIFKKIGQKKELYLRLEGEVFLALKAHAKKFI